MDSVVVVYRFPKYPMTFVLIFPFLHKKNMDANFRNTVSIHF